MSHIISIDQYYHCWASRKRYGIETHEWHGTAIHSEPTVEAVRGEIEPLPKAFMNIVQLLVATNRRHRSVVVDGMSSKEWSKQRNMHTTTRENSNLLERARSYICVTNYAAAKEWLRKLLAIIDVVGQLPAYSLGCFTHTSNQTWTLSDTAA